MDLETLFARWVTRLRHEEPHAVAILCHGSYARGAAEQYSDLDLDVLIEEEPDVPYRSAFELLPDGRLLHATIQNKTLAEWVAQFVEPQESEAWAFYLPTRQVARVLWATPAAHAQLEACMILESAGSPQLQDLIESAAKVRNALARGDDLGVRLGAQDLVLRCPALLGLIVPLLPVETRRDALQAALDMQPAPEGYRDDMLTCLGMSGGATTVQDVHDATLRLARAIVALLRAHPDQVAGRVEPGLPEALADGTVERLLS